MKLFKVLLTLTYIALFQNNAFSQNPIPNAGFEDWTNDEPDNWYSNNFTGLAVPVTQSSQSHSGSSAIKIEVLSTAFGNYAGYIWSGSASFGGFPISEAYGSLTGYYQFNRVGDDEVYVVVYTQKNGTYIGGGSTIISAGTNSYSQFVVPIFQSDVPDTASIWIAISDSSDGDVSPGTFVLIDDLEFGGTVDVNDKKNTPETFLLKQNYPNPFNPSTTIEFSIPEESFVDLKVYDILGSEVAALVSDTYTPGSYRIDFNGENLASGIYLAKINATAKKSNLNFSKTLKMSLLK
jgi:hypothetical protein